MGILDGIRILELGRVAPAELPGMLFGDLGADVIKVEAPASHETRTVAARTDARYAPTNRNKRSIAIDLKSTRGREVFLRLAATADAVIEGFRPGVVDRLGVGYRAVRAINPEIVYCSMSSFGQTGPYSQHSAHDLNFLGTSGVLNLIGEPGRKPAIPINLVADLGGAGMNAAFAVAAALLGRARNGRGQYIDLSYLDSTIALLAPTTAMRSYFSAGIAAQRGEGVNSGAYPFYSVYETSDGVMITLACSEPALWEKFCRLVERPDLLPFSRKRENYDRAPNAAEAAARDAVARLILTRSRDAWFDFLSERGVCVGKVLEVDEMIVDPQVVHRGMIVDLAHPDGTLRQIGPAVKYAPDAAAARSVSPLAGENSRELLRQAGCRDEEIDALVANGVVQQLGEAEVTNQAESGRNA